MPTQPLRLSPTSTSRRAIMLEFVRRYFRQFGCSPSFGEIAAELDVPVQRVGALVRVAAAKGEIGWTPGKPRSLVLPEQLGRYPDTELLLELHKRGFVINPGTIGQALASAYAGVTDRSVSLRSLIGDEPSSTGVRHDPGTNYQPADEG